MKVGILTLPLWHNYGGILQAYALRLAVEKLGHESIFIDIKRDSLGITRYGINQTKRLVKRNFFKSVDKPYYPNSNELKNISSNTRLFVEKKINPSSNHIPLSSLPKFSECLDAIIVGSDQVWRPEYCPNLELYFLDFAQTNLKKISYAASLGTSDWRFSPEETARCGKLLNQFHAVSVREDSAIDLIRKNMNVEAVQSCDPTLLLDAQDYLAVANIPLTASSGGRGVFCYLLDPEEPRMQGLSEIGTQLDYELFYIMPKIFDKNYSKFSDDYVFSTVESWIQAFQESDYIVTDSFHGCVFSIIFNKPFIAIANTNRGRTRFESLLKVFNLEERLFDCVADIDEKVLNKPINWIEVNKKRKSQKYDGYKFLGNSLTLESK